MNNKMEKEAVEEGSISHRSKKSIEVDLAQIRRDVAHFTKLADESVVNGHQTLEKDDDFDTLESHGKVSSLKLIEYTDLQSEQFSSYRIL